ncbi:MAG: tRNA-dihydrouridine synthase C [Paraglaciecola psychrophila]|jgi:tRNA-dihydrouridine synthase C
MLAPMEGVVDHTMRDMLTRLGGLDRCTTEFVRITDHCLPAKVYYRFCPELHNGGLTPSGTPVYVQLLGGQPEPMAMNAQRAALLGAPGIDINFGCPAKQVNRSDGGSVLLKSPDRVFNIVDAVRRAVPAATPVTVKIRLGYSDRSLLSEVCAAVFAAAANELTIHARTKEDGYKPPAYWQAIAAIKDSSPIPIIANGEIWSPSDYFDCIEQSHCQDIMLGRGLLAYPELARQIKATAQPESPAPMQWLTIVDLLEQFCVVTEQEYESKHVGNRVKQWLGYLRRQYQQADVLFESVKRLKLASDIDLAIGAHRQAITGS